MTPRLQQALILAIAVVAGVVGQLLLRTTQLYGPVMSGAGILIGWAGLTNPADKPAVQAFGALKRTSKFNIPAGLGVLCLCFVALPGCPKGVGIKWPDVAVCGPQAGDLVGVLTQLLFNDTGIDTVSEAGKQQIEQLAMQYGAETVLCVIQQLAKGWAAPGASPHPQRLAALKRTQGFLASTGTKFQ